MDIEGMRAGTEVRRLLNYGQEKPDWAASQVLDSDSISGDLAHRLIQERDLGLSSLDPDALSSAIRRIMQALVETVDDPDSKPEEPSDEHGVIIAAREYADLCVLHGVSLLGATAGLRVLRQECRWMLASRELTELLSRTEDVFDVMVEKTTLSYLKTLSKPGGAAAEAVRQASERLEAIIHASPHPIMALDRNRNLTIWNPAAQLVFGWSAEDILGQPVPIVPLDRAADFGALCDRAFAGEIMAGFETAGITKSGSRNEISIAIAPYHDVVGRTIGVMFVVTDVTEAKSAQRETDRSLSMLQATLESTADGIFVVDLNRNINALNQRFAEIFGLTEDMLTGEESQRRLAHVAGQTTDPSGFRERVRELMDDPDAEVVDLIELTNGRVFERFSKPQRLEGETIGRVWSFHDVTELKRSAERVAQLASHNELLLNSIGDGVFGISVSGVITFINPVGATLLGWEVNELIGRDSHETFHHTTVDGSPYRRTDCPTYAAIMGGAATCAAKEVFWRKDGASFPVEYVTTPIRADDKVLGAVVSFKDISGRVEMEATLRESETRYRTLFESANDAIYLLDPKTARILDCNRKATEMDGYSKEELTSMTVPDIHPPEERPILPEKFREVREAGAGTGIRGLHHLSKDGRLVPIEVNAAMVELGGRQLNLSIVRDVTEREAAQQHVARLAEESRLLLDVSEIISGSLRLEEIMTKLVAAATSLTGIGRASVLLADPSERPRFAASTDSHLNTEELRQESIDQLSAEPDVIDRIQEVPPSFLSATPSDMLSALVVPFWAGGDCLGALILDEPAERSDFTKRQRRMAEAIGHQATVAIQNAQAYETQHRIAGVLQRSLLPEPVERLRNLKVGVRYVSATEGALIGGDFYDYFELPDGRVAVAVGDVSGKGLEAAIETAMVRYSFETLIAIDPSPAKVLEALNNSLAIRLSRGRFITMFYALIDPSTGEVTCANAGHLPPILLQASGGGRLCDEVIGGLALGIFSDRRFDQCSMALAPEDVLLLYTDGLTEARSAADRSIMFSGERALESLLKPGVLGASESVDTLYQAVVEFAGGQLHDDLAIVALGMRPPDGPGA